MSDQDQHDFRIGDLVLYKNNQLIAFNKPGGIPVQHDPSGDKSLLDLAEIYAKSKVKLIHRLDRPASGVVLFAQNEKAQANLSEQFKNRQVEKTYLAITAEKPDPEKGILTHQLLKTPHGNKSVAVEEGQANTKEAVLQYELLGSSDNYHLLKIKLITGRHHQIRAQLAAVNCPVKGDVKYGARRKNKDRSIHLHAWKLRFKHPVSNDWEEITAPLPDEPLWDYFGKEVVGKEGS